MKLVPKWLPENLYNRKRELRIRCEECGWSSTVLQISATPFRDRDVEKEIFSELGDQKCHCYLPENFDPNLIELS